MAHAIDAFRAQNTSFRFGVSAIIFLLIALACIVPGAVTGIVVTAIDFLLNDHVPSSIKSCAYAAVTSFKNQLLYGGAIETASMLLSLQLARLGGDTWNTSACSATSTAELGASSCAATWQNGSYVADALNRMAAGAPASVRTAISMVLNNSVAWSTSLGVTYWQRTSAHSVALAHLATCSDALFWRPAAAPPSTMDDGNRSLVLAVNASTASRFLVTLDPHDGSMRWLFPVSQPALAQSTAVLVDGVYLHVGVAGRCLSNDSSAATNGSSSTTTSAACSSISGSTVPPVYGPSLWSRVFAASTIEVRPLLTSVAGSLSFGPSAIGLFDTVTRQLTACAEGRADEAPPSVAAASVAVPLQAEEASASAVQSAAPTLSNLAGCQAVYRFLTAQSLNDVDPAANVLLSTASSAYYIASYPLTINTTSATTSPLTPHEHALQSYVMVVVVPRGSTESNIVRARGQIAVVAFVVAAVTVFVLVVTIRLMTQPLPAITRAIDACATLQLHRIEMMEASMIVEISEIQKSLAYLAIRLHHYIKFIPDRKIIDGIARLPSDDDDDDESSGDDGSSEASSDNDGRFEGTDGASANGAGKPATATSSKSKSQHRAHRHEDDEFSLEEKLADQRRIKPPKAPLHSVMVDVVYESRHLNRNTLYRQKLPSKSTRFVFRHRVTDPVLAMLTRQCREHLNERPGETLVVFAGRRDGGSNSEYAMRQLCTDEDVLFAFEAFKTQRVGATAAVETTSTTAAAMPLPVVTLCVRKGAVQSVLPVLIALGTVMTVVSRFVLSVQRLASNETDTQLLGLLLLGCLGVQVAQNALISLYLVRRFRVIDRDFRAWAEVSRNEVVLGVVFGSLNVTNLEIMGCHVRLSHNLRLSAPISSRLRVKISMYSFVGFIVGDLLPFVFILIYTILTDQYRDPYVVVPVVFSVLSVSSILVSHGIMRFVVSETLASKSSASASGGGVKGGAGMAGAAGSPALGRSLLLSRKDMTVLHIRITKEDVFLDRLSISLVDILLDRLYDAVQTSVKRSGGLLLEARGLSLVMVWNAHAVVPHHTCVAYHVFLKLREDIERNVLPQFFGLEKLRSHVAAGLSASARRYPAEITKAVFALHGKHRLVGSLVSGEMAMGYVGTLTAQTFQRVGYHGPLCDAVCRLNELYGSTLLTTGASLQALQQTESNCVSRKIDAILLSSEFVAPVSDAGLLAPYVAEVASTASSTTSRSTPMTVHADVMLPFVPEDAPPIEVHELIVHAFLPPDAVGGGGGGLSPAPATFSHQQLRRRPRTHKTVEAIRSYVDAMEIWHAFSNDAPLLQYTEQFPEDAVAKAVMRWETFVPAPNSSDAIQYPRLLTSLGLSRHVCETELGAALVPAHVVSETERVMEDYHERLAQRNRLLRPPRSERRAKQYEDTAKRGGGATTGLGGTSNEVIEQVLAADNAFTVTFQNASLEEHPMAHPSTVERRQ